MESTFDKLVNIAAKTGDLFAKINAQIPKEENCQNREKLFKVSVRLQTTFHDLKLQISSMLTRP